VILLPGDVTTEAEAITQSFVEAAGAMDTLVNNAGVMPARKPLADLSLEQFRSTVELNLLAPFGMSKAAASHMTEGSAIINLASLGGMQIWNRRIDYNTSKSALITLTKALARELAPRRITVNAIAPGAIQVEDEGAQRMGIAEDKIPMGHYGNPGDIAKATLFLAYEAPYMTGETLIIDGGRHVIG
jgi:NAD(P)-dependent dehydrogenase (short-subunit alcohol dehydrogenase family)